MSAPFARFVADLPPESVDRRLREAIEACDKAQAGVVLWLADVQRRGLCRALGHPSPLQYATESLGMSRSRAYDLLQLARDLERLPHLREAMAEGRVGWTKARLVARAATPATEGAWVDAAARLGRRALAAAIETARERARRQREQRRRDRAAQLAGQSGLAWDRDVPEAYAPTLTTMTPDGMAAAAEVPGRVAARVASPAAAAPAVVGPGRSDESVAAATPASEARSLVAAPTPATSASEARALVAVPPVCVSFRLSGLEHARYEGLLEQVYRRRVVPPQAGREQVLLEAMSALAEGTPGLAAGGGSITRAASEGSESSRLESPIHYQIIVYRCRECGAADVVAGGVRRRLSWAEAGCSACDARVRETGQPNHATIPPSVRALVLARDGHRCQAPGCHGARFLEVHHVVPRSEGGAHRPANLVTLCGRCHRFAHERPQVVRQWFAGRWPGGAV